MESAKEDARDSLGLRGFDQVRFSWLDVKLGLRLLRKYPALSLVSTAGIAVAVAIGAGGFGVIGTLTASDLPLHEGNRLMTIENLGFRQDRSGPALLFGGGRLLCIPGTPSP